MNNITNIQNHSWFKVIVSIVSIIAILSLFLGAIVYTANVVARLLGEVWELKCRVDELIDMHNELIGQIQGVKQVAATYNPALAEEVAIEIVRAAMHNNLDPMLICSVIAAESSFNTNAVSNKGAIGLMQLMPATAAMLGVDPHDWKQNIAGGTEYLKTLIDRFGHVEIALAAYNAGPTRISRSGASRDMWPRATRTYVAKVMTMHGGRGDK